MAISAYHCPVMVGEVVENLAIRRGGVYLDLTFGGGGHARAILEKLPEGRLWGLDQDSDAVEEAKKLKDPRFCFIQGNFRFFRRLLSHQGVTQVDGILADLGVSSHQLDSRARGFAARLEGPLDMRMYKKEGGTTAASLLSALSERALEGIFREYGDLPNSRVLAKQLVVARRSGLITTSGDLKKAVATLLPKHREYKYFAKLFQALRIAVNDEMGALEDMLLQIPYMLAPGGRAVVITYHSGEDRLVKRFFKTGNLQGVWQKDFYGNLLRPLVPVGGRALSPSSKEIFLNNRARSARMRVATLPR